MKDISEYNLDDLDMVKEQACKIAMASIHSTYEEIHDEDEVCIEDLHKVKKAIQILDLLHHKV